MILIFSIIFLVSCTSVPSKEQGGPAGKKTPIETLDQTRQTKKQAPTEPPEKAAADRRVSVSASFEVNQQNYPFIEKGIVKGLNFHNNRFFLPLNSTLKIQLNAQNNNLHEVRWTFFQLKETQEQKLFSRLGNQFSFPIEQRMAFRLQLKTIINQQVINKNFYFHTAPTANISITQPQLDKVLKEDQKVTLQATVNDGLGNRPLIAWVLKNKNYERLLGVGPQIEVKHLDRGYNEVRAVAMNWQGQQMHSRPVGLILPVKKVATQIKKPQNGSRLQPGKPVIFFAEGVDLQYSLDGEEFRPGGGFIRLGLISGAHRVTFRGRFGQASADFFIDPAPKQVARVVRIQGSLLLKQEKGFWRKIKEGAALPAGSVIQPGFKSLAEIQTREGMVHMIKSGESARLTTKGKLIRNLPAEELVVYQLIYPEDIQMAVDQLEQTVAQLKELQKTHYVQSITVEEGADVHQLIDLILQGKVEIKDIRLE